MRGLQSLLGTFIICIALSSCTNSDQDKNIYLPKDVVVYDSTKDSLIGPVQEVAEYKAFPKEKYQVSTVLGVGSFYIDNPNDWIKKQLHAGKIWEPNIVELIKEYAKPGTIAIDIGAHIGTHVLTMSDQVGDQGRVYAFEPQKKIFSELRMNLILNQRKNVITYRCAIGKEFGNVQMDAIFAANEGSSMIGEGGDSSCILPLDSFNLKNVSLIKIDVENFENDVLDGARQTILDSHPYILIEIMGNLFKNPFNREQKIRETIIKLQKMGYLVKFISDNPDEADWLAIPISKLKE